MKNPVRIIGIAGPSCSGKSTLAKHLSVVLDGATQVIGIDSYYHDRTGVPEKEINVDVPGAIEHDLLITHLQRLAAGLPVERPVYDYATHSRAPQGLHVLPADNVVVEGLFALYWEELRALFDLGVFMEVDHATCIERRIERDVRERGRTRESVIDVYEKKVRPMYETYVHDTREHADLTLYGIQPVSVVAAMVVEEMSRD